MHYSRLMWGARKRTRHPGTLNPNQVNAIVLHYPGMTSRVRGVAKVKAYLRGIQGYHMDSNGWSDIAYQVAIDQDGNSYKLRGRNYRSAANGNTELNLSKCAFLLLVAENETPTPEMIAKTKKLVANYRKRYKHANKIQGHGEVRPGGTSCPGIFVQSLIRTGVFK